MLQVRRSPGPKLGFGGSLEPNSLLEIDKVNQTFRGGWNSILDRSADTGDPSEDEVISGHFVVNANLRKFRTSAYLRPEEKWTE